MGGGGPDSGEGQNWAEARNLGKGGGVRYSFYKMFPKLFTMACKQVNFSYGLEDTTTAVGKPRK